MAKLKIRFSAARYSRDGDSHVSIAGNSRLTHGNASSSSWQVKKGVDKSLHIDEYLRVRMDTDGRRGRR
jgi:hypothetical protein